MATLFHWSRAANSVGTIGGCKSSPRPMGALDARPDPKRDAARDAFRAEALRAMTRTRFRRLITRGVFAELRRAALELGGLPSRPFAGGPANA